MFSMARVHLQGTKVGRVCTLSLTSYLALTHTHTYIHTPSIATNALY
jgi:hypothetical protein